MKGILKILIVIFVANGLWRVSTAYVSYYKFKDAVNELASHTGGRSEAQIKDKVLELAGTYDEPVDPDSLSVRLDDNRVYVDTEYTKPITLLPGYDYKWLFKLNVEGYALARRLDDLPNAK